MLRGVEARLRRASRIRRASIKRSADTPVLARATRLRWGGETHSARAEAATRQGCAKCASISACSRCSRSDSGAGVLAGMAAGAGVDICAGICAGAWTGTSAGALCAMARAVQPSKQALSPPSTRARALEPAGKFLPDLAHGLADPWVGPHDRRPRQIPPHIAHAHEKLVHELVGQRGDPALRVRLKAKSVHMARGHLDQRPSKTRLPVAVQLRAATA